MHEEKEKHCVTWRDEISLSSFDKDLQNLYIDDDDDEALDFDLEAVGQASNARSIALIDGELSVFAGCPKIALKDDPLLVESTLQVAPHYL